MSLDGRVCLTCGKGIKKINGFWFHNSIDMTHPPQVHYKLCLGSDSSSNVESDYQAAVQQNIQERNDKIITELYRTLGSNLWLDSLTDEQLSKILFDIMPVTIRQLEIRSTTMIKKEA